MQLVLVLCNSKALAQRLLEGQLADQSALSLPALQLTYAPSLSWAAAVASQQVESAAASVAPYRFSTRPAGPTSSCILASRLHCAGSPLQMATSSGGRPAYALQHSNEAKVSGALQDRRRQISACSLASRLRCTGSPLQMAYSSSSWPAQLGVRSRRFGQHQRAVLRAQTWTASIKARTLREQSPAPACPS